jgi:ATP:ADP antiporter, AAA family
MSIFFDNLKTERGKRILISMLALSFSIAFLVAGYEFIRSAAESLLIYHYGVANKPYAMAMVPFAMALFIYGYGRLLSLLGSKKAFLASILFSMILFVVFFIGLKNGYKPFAFLLYLFKEAYIVILIEQIWSFINSTLKTSEAKLYNGPITGMAAFGPIMAGYLIARYAVEFSTENFILAAAVMMIPTFIFAWIAYNKGGEPVPLKDETGGVKGHMGLHILKENKTIRYIALVVFSTQIVSALMDLRFSQLVQDSIIGKDLRTAYFGAFWMKVNIVAFVMQFLITPILMKKVSIRVIQVAIPLVHCVNFMVLFIYPQLAFASFAFLTFKGLDYSIFRASKETLYIPFSYDTRYRAKQIADAFTYRFSKGFTALCISVISSFTIISGVFYAIAGILFSGIWTAFAFPLTKDRTNESFKV